MAEQLGIEIAGRPRPFARRPATDDFAGQTLIKDLIDTINTYHG
jgi:hypothetical protein